MRIVIIILVLIIGLWFEMKAQPISNDTVVCFIDTAKYYVHYKTNPHGEKDTSCVWQVSIEGHYYDISFPQHKDFACIVFNADNLRNIHGPNFKGPFSIRVPKELIKRRFVFANEEWINQQIDFRALGKKIGFFPRDRYNFIVFKQDFEDAKNDSVTLHRVQIGYCEIHE